MLSDMAEPLPPIAVALRTARARAGVSQYELARLSGVARITIASIEGGKHPTVRTGTAEKLAGCLGLTAGELIAAPSRATAPADSKDAEKLLKSYQALKKGTVMTATAAETGWLRHMLGAWRGENGPSLTSVLFLLLALRHGESKKIR